VALNPLHGIGRAVRTFSSVVRFRRFERDATKRRLSRAAAIADLRGIARHRLPRGVFDYIDGGAEDERTLRENSAAFGRIEFVPRVLHDVATIDTTTTLLGHPLPYPLVLAPIGFARVAHSQGELAGARAAARAGIPYTLSTLGTRSIEDLRDVSNGALWFQVYVWKDRGLVAEMIGRARACGYQALALTVDTAVLGRRDRDVRRGFSMPPTLGPGTIVDGMLHPGWVWDFIRAEPIRFANLSDSSRPGGDGTAVNLSAFANSQFDQTLSWPDVEWMRSQWDGPIVIKGIQRVEDALIAADMGIEAVAVSNHGGRQLDGAPPSIELVAPVVDAVGDRVEVICDGGVRRGSDVVKAVALGARACMIGRAWVYGLAAGGEQGVDHALGLLTSDIRRTLALLGRPSISELDRSHVRIRPPHPEHV
jgi:L-lactate dehydrogenase (cytochrome)